MRASCLAPTTAATHWPRSASSARPGNSDAVCPSDPSPSWVTSKSGRAGPVEPVAGQLADGNYGVGREEDEDGRNHPADPAGLAATSTRTILIEPETPTRPRLPRNHDGNDKGAPRL